MAIHATESAIGRAVDWLTGLLLGSIGTTIAVLAIATIGLLMMNGRMPRRRAATVIIGCFILFGAGAIANGIVGSLGDPGPPPPVVIAEPAYRPATSKPLSNDPYAGASVPDQRTKDIFR